MLKTGLYQIKDLADPKNLQGLFGGRRKISVTLYEKVGETPDPDKYAELFLLNFCDTRGIFKRTYAARFDKFDAEALRHIEENFRPDTPLKIHDAGVSDGRTAVDFFYVLTSRFNDVDYVASDFDATVFIIEHKRAKIV